MFEQLIKRENTIFNILEDFINAKLNFIVVGGYAISAYKHRFSVDADIIIKNEDKTKFEEILKKRKLIKTTTKELNHAHTKEFIRYKTRDKFPVNIDLLINGIGSRTTNASYSLEELEKYSQKRKIIGRQKEIIVLIPNKEILITLKLHSGRLTDFRDIAALGKDLDFKLISSLIWRGKREIVKNNIKKLLSLLEKKEFIDSFKGVFIEKKYDTDLEEIKKFNQLLD